MLIGVGVESRVPLATLAYLWRWEFQRGGATAGQGAVGRAWGAIEVGVELSPELRYCPGPRGQLGGLGQLKLRQWRWDSPE